MAILAPAIQFDNLNLLIEAAPIAATLVDSRGMILSINSKFETLFGYQPHEIIGQPLEHLIPQRFRTIHRIHRTAYTMNPRVRMMGSGVDLLAQHKDGTEFPIEAGLSYLEIEGQTVVQALITDMSSRVQERTVLEQRIRERTYEIEQRRRVADGLRDLLSLLNADHSIDTLLTHIVQQAYERIGSDASLIYQLADTPADSYPFVTANLDNRYHASPQRLQYEIALTQANPKQPITVANIAQTLPNAAVAAGQQALREAGYHALILVPLIVKNSLYGGLIWYHQQPKRFSSEAIDLAVTFGDQASLALENARLRVEVERSAVEAERSRLARDLHDSVTQTLFSASVIAEVLPRLWARSPEQTEARLSELRHLTRGALAEMRTLLLELRPTTLTEVPLSDLLKQLTAATIGRAHIPIALHVEGTCHVPDGVQIALYRITQEALNNVAKHAQAQQATVQLRCTAQQVELTITDDGDGFTIETVKPDSLGLNIMRERAEGIGAALAIRSQPHEGTEIQVVWRCEQS